MDEAFLHERSIDIETYDRHCDKLRQELKLAQIERHSTELEEMDVEGVLGFAERILPSASNLWVPSSLAQKQRLQRVFFPDGVSFDGKRLVGTGTTLLQRRVAYLIVENETDANATFAHWRDSAQAPGLPTGVCPRGHSDGLSAAAPRDRDA